MNANEFKSTEKLAADAPSESGKEGKELSLSYRWGKTVIIIIAYTIYGMAMNLVSLTIPDLCDKMDITTEEIGWAISAGSASWIIASILMGMAIDHLTSYFDLMMAACFVLLGVFALLKPFMPTLWAFILLMFLEGFVFATIDPLCNVQVLDMWGDDADAKTQILHLSWSVGSIIIPLIVRPFLVDRPEDIISNTTNVTTMAMVTDDTDQVNELDFEIPYLIIGCVCLLTGVVALCIYVCKPANGIVLSKKPTEKGDDNTMETDRCFFIQMLVLCCLLMFAIVGREYTLNTWLFTYAIESDLPFTKSEAALLASANKAAFTAGMVFSAAASKFVGPPPILFTVAGAGMILSLALGIWGTQCKTALWAISCILNLAQGPLWPTSILFTDKYIRASALVIGVLYAGAGMAAVIFHWLTGYLFTNAESADSFMYILVGCAAMLCIVLTVMQCVGMKHGNRYENERKLKAQEEVASTYL